MNKHYYTLEWYEDGEYYGFNKFYSLKALKAFLRITTLDRAKHEEQTGKKLSYKIIKTDEYDEFWSPSYEVEEQIGWKELTMEDIANGR